MKESYSNKNSYKLNKIRQILSISDEPVRLFIKENISEINAKTLEIDTAKSVMQIDNNIAYVMGNGKRKTTGGYAWKYVENK